MRSKFLVCIPISGYHPPWEQMITFCKLGVATCPRMKIRRATCPCMRIRRPIWNTLASCFLSWIYVLRMRAIICNTPISWYTLTWHRMFTFWKLGVFTCACVRMSSSIWYGVTTCPWVTMRRVRMRRSFYNTPISGYTPTKNPIFTFWKVRVTTCTCIVIWKYIFWFE